MSDLLKYGVSLEYQNFKKTLDQTKKSIQSFNKIQENALKRQIALRKQLLRLEQQSSKVRTLTPSPKGVGDSLVSGHKQTGKDTSQRTLSEYDSTQKAMTKRHEQGEKERTRITLEEQQKRAKAQQKIDNTGNARRKQQLKSVPTTNPTVVPSQEVNTLNVKESVEQKPRKVKDKLDVADERSRKSAQEQLGKVESARRKQAVQSITEHTGSEKMKAFYQDEQKKAKVRQQIEDKANKQRTKDDNKRFKESVENLTKGYSTAEMKKYYQDLEKQSLQQYKKEKQQLDMIQNARTKQAVKKITEPSGAEGMRSFYKQQETMAKHKQQLDDKANKQRTKQDKARFKESVENLTKSQNSAEMKKYYKDLEKQSEQRAKKEKAQTEMIERARRKQAVQDITAPSGAESMRSFYKEQEKLAKLEETRKSKQRDADLENTRKVEAARRKQAVEDLTKPDPNRAAMEKHYRELEISERRRIKALEKARDTVMHSNLMLKKTKDIQEQTVQLSLKGAIAQAKTAEEVRRQYKIHMQNNRELKKQNFLMDRLKSSSEQFAGNMISAFAVAGAGVFITQTGQQFEAVQNTMLAVSEDADAAGENFEFVQNQAFRLGLGLQESAKGFAKMVAARGDMSMEDTEQSFLGVAEMSTLLGLSADESNRAINALQQMMSKGSVSAEELKLQMGEVMPNAIQLMAKAAKDAGLTVNGTVKEMLELQQTGGLISSKVLPHFAQQMRDAAAANGGLEKALQSNRVAMNQMFTSFQMAANDFFTGGFSDGLTAFFKATANMMKDNSLLWSRLGKIVGSVMKGLAWVVEKVLDPALGALGSIMNFLTTVFGDFSGIILGIIVSLTPVGRILGAIFTRLSGGRGVIHGLGKAFAGIVAPIMLALGALEEIAEFFAPSGKKTLLGFNINDITPEVSKITETIKGNQVIKDTMGSDADKVYRFMDAQKPPTMFPQGSGYGAAAEAEQVIRVESTVNIDGEKVGEAVAETSTMQEMTDRAVAARMAGNTY